MRRSAECWPTGISGYRRARYGPTRDRILEMTVVTGDGRIVKAGGRVVKNVTGYDLPRLVVGSFGALGVIVSACLKLWPLPNASATVTLRGSRRTAALVYRPLAVAGRPEQHEGFPGRHPGRGRFAGRPVGGIVRAEASPGPTAPAGETTWSLRVPPSMVDAALSRLPPDASRIAQTTGRRDRVRRRPTRRHGRPPPVGRVGGRKIGAHQGTRCRLRDVRSVGQLRPPALDLQREIDRGLRSTADHQSRPAARGDLTCPPGSPSSARPGPSCLLASNAGSACRIARPSG